MYARVILFRRIVFCLLLPFCGIAVSFYTPKLADPVLEPWRWRHEEALAGLGVLCMDEAEGGILWFGNVGSIARYDGVTVEKIPFDDELLATITSQKKIPWAKALLVLPDDRLLVLIGESLMLRTDGEWKVVIQDAGRSNFSARLSRADDGTFWLIVPDALWRISSDFTEISVVMKPAENGSLESFCMDLSGSLWVIERTGELSSRLVKISVQDGLPGSDRIEFPVPFENERIGAYVIAARDGLIWYGSGSDRVGLEAFDPRRGEWVVQSGNHSPLGISSLLETRDGKIWAGAEGLILCRPPQEGEVLYSREQLRLPRSPLALFEARNGRIWIIGRIGYVYSVDVSFNEWMTCEGLHFKCESSDGVQWFVSRRILVVSHDPRSGEWRQYQQADGLIDRIDALICSSQGLIWAAGSHAGRAAFAVFDGIRWTRFCHPDFARWIEPNAVFEAADGTVWFGAGGRMLVGVPQAGGALQYKVNKDRSVELVKQVVPPVFPYYVTSLAQTPDHTLWVGSTLIQCYGDVSQPARQFPEIQGENTVAMTLDRDQTLWVAKEHFGVCRWQENSWKVYGIEDGLASLFLSGLLALDDGSILASSEMGISRFDGKTWTAHAYPETFAMSSRWSSMRKSGDGSVWFNYFQGELRGANLTVSLAGLYCSTRHRMETNPPDTQITGYLKRVSQPGNSFITWSAHDPWSSTLSKDIEYSWRLDGGEWSAFSRETGKTFLELDSGRHALEVRSRDLAFNVDPTPARVEFTVIPPIWRQAWFVALVSVLGGLILLLIWILIQTRERYLRNQQAEREAFLVKQQEEREKNLLERQQEHEALLVRQQEEKERHLTELDRIKTGFFINISHELRTPMTVISGRLQMIFDSEPDDKRKNALSIVLRNAQRVMTLITQLLDFRKIQEGKIRIEATRGDLIPPLRDWIASLQVLAERAGLTLSPAIPETCCGEFDFDKLQKIFTNLIANSIKYTKSGGEVRVVLRKEADCNGEQRLIFAVEDNGVGIPPEHINQIFDRFYRVSEESMAVGAGIGLNLTKELVDLLGGEIQVESPIHPDATRPGSRFAVRLPVEQRTESGDQKSGDRDQESAGEESGEPLCSSSPLCPSPETDGEAPLILIVEDDVDIRNFIIEGLASEYRMESAKNGEIGLRMAKEQVPDLIVTDLMMPVMDGVALCRELKTSVETSHIPVVMLTAKASLDSQLEGLKTGADDYMTKPFHVALLQARIANLLESRRVLREKLRQDLAAFPLIVPVDTQEKEFLGKLNGVMDENVAEWSFDVDQFAAAMHMSRSTLKRKLKAVMDQTPMGVLNDFRIKRAAELLIHTACPVADIAFQVGIEEPSNFNRMFKKYHQMTPSQYRSAHKRS